MLHVTLHAHPGLPLTAESYTWQGRCFQRFQLASDALTRPLPQSFDDVLRRLNSMPRCYTEPDGSFLWTSEHGPARWQIDGQLHDSAQGLMTVELKVSGAECEPTADRSGSSLPDAWKQLIKTGLGTAPASLVYQLVRPGAYVEDVNFD